MTTHFLYMFDPLCGWCYGASAGIATLAAQPGLSMELLPTGLFAGSGARMIAGSMRDHIVASDQRIATLTGAIFSDVYRDTIVGGGFRLDSGAASLALSAVAMFAPNREIEALGIIQRARYVDGRDITDPATLGALLEAAGLETAAKSLASPSRALLDAHAQRLDRAQSIMRRLGISGVPALLRVDGDVLTPVDTSILYQDSRSLLSSAGFA